MDKNQVLMFSRAELELIKQTFAENDTLLYTMRSVLLQFPISEVEKGNMRMQLTPEVLKVVRKRLIGSMSSDTPLTQLGDLYQTLTNDLKTRSPEEMAPLFQAKKLEAEYLEQQWKALTEDVDEKIKLADLAVITNDHHQNYVNTIARNFLLGYIDPMMNYLKALAGAKEESPEAQAERLTRDSSQ